MGERLAFINPFNFTDAYTFDTVFRDIITQSNLKYSVKRENILFSFGSREILFDIMLRDIWEIHSRDIHFFDISYKIRNIRRIFE